MQVIEKLHRVNVEVLIDERGKEMGWLREFERA